jgi:hypothetical protein
MAIATTATLSFCRVAGDMIGLGVIWRVNSVGNHNHPLCWSIIPHNTEEELTYTGTFLELQEATMLLNDIHTCPDADCALCDIYDELMQKERVQKFFNSNVTATVTQMPRDRLAAAK